VAQYLHLCDLFTLSVWGSSSAMPKETRRDVFLVVLVETQWNSGLDATERPVRSLLCPGEEHGSEADMVSSCEEADH